MEGKNQSGSSFTDLFGAKDSTPSSSTGIFATMFPPPSSTVGGKYPPGSGSDVAGSWGKQSSRNEVWNPKQAASARSGEEANRKEERVEPCHLSSSLYYGGQDVYSQSSGNQAPGSYPNFKKDGGEGQNGNNSQSAARGNWWQGSLYY